MGRFLVIVSIAMVFMTVGCHQPSEVPTEQYTETVSSSDRVYYVPTADSDFLALTQKAKKTLPAFLDAARDKSWGDGVYALKVGFPTEDGNREHLWLQPTEIRTTDFTGTVQNKPVKAKRPQFGQSVTCQISDVSDWAYYATDGTVRGAFTSPKSKAD